jgi:probable F420-dependent oxidoreductase
VRLGTLVLDNDFRHPAVLAKEAATIDVLTGGRFELGLGAGWLVKDYDSTGLPFAPAGERFERLRETVAILKGYFGQTEALTHEGKHYQVRELDTSPRPVQTPHPPILIGGRQKRMLSFAAREADIVSISMLDPRRPDLPKPPTFAEKVSWVRAAASERIEDIELHVNASNIEVTDNADEAMARLTQRLQITPEEALLSPANLIGSVDEIIERMNAWREQTGVSYFNIQGRLMDNVAAVVARAVGT